MRGAGRGQNAEGAKVTQKAQKNTENGLGLSSGLGSGYGASAAWPALRLFHPRQNHICHQPALLMVAQHQLAAHVLNHFFHNRQAKPAACCRGACLIGAEKGLRKPR